MIATTDASKIEVKPRADLAVFPCEADGALARTKASIRSKWQPYQTASANGGVELHHTERFALPSPQEQATRVTCCIHVSTNAG